MPRVVFVLSHGDRRTVEAHNGFSIMVTAIDHDIPGITGECGGACACATCHVYIDAADMGRVPAANPIEREMLDGVAAERRAESRLGCQIPVCESLDGIVVHVPDRQS